jgi:hypothetical protein
MINTNQNSYIHYLRLLILINVKLLKIYKMIKKYLIILYRLGRPWPVRIESGRVKEILNRF